MFRPLFLEHFRNGQTGLSLDRAFNLFLEKNRASSY